MAKAKLSPTLAEMESQLGYKVDFLTYPGHSLTCFYSNLRPVPSNTYGRIRVEFEEHEKKRYSKDKKSIWDKVLPGLGAVRKISHGEDTVTLTRWNSVGFHNFTVDIHHGYGFDMSLLVTSEEASRTLSVAKLQRNQTSSATPTFFGLPTEIRAMIYTFALPMGRWQINDTDACDGLDFAGSIGDPSGFCFPLSSKLPVLGVDRQMRREALPLAYRRTIFHLDDMDDLIKLLIAVGSIGRDNIESLELSWRSRADCELKWDEAPDSDDLFLKLPTLHATKCVQLLKQCKRLEFLRLYFESELITDISPDTFKTDPGVHELCSIRGIKKVQIGDLANEPIEQCDLAQWLKEEMESPWVEGGNGRGRGSAHEIITNELES